ncbi:MAG: phospholipid-binding protein MlaC [Candidatus Binatia bacterium]
MMNPLRSRMWQIVISATLAMSVPVWAATDSPLSVIRATIEQSRRVMENPIYQGTDKRHLRLEKLKEVVLPQFDSQEVARRTLGIYWRQLSHPQREEFIRLFTSLVEKTYASNLDRYTKNVQFFYDDERIDGTFSEVATRIFDPGHSKTFSLNYRLHKVEGRWLVYDVVIENISLVQNYRNQFNRILSKSSYEDLVKRIQSKLQELDAETAPSIERQG